ncbi:MAG TPA: phosphatase PAP2 family protein [Pseudoxanthomonas sp.]|nr:phosphatase PAP2 family protein [Pseudoxanthomonas sp.]
MQFPFFLFSPRSLPAIGSGLMEGNRARVRLYPASLFYRRHLLAPLAVFACVSILLIGLHGDLWWADRLYAMQGHAWALQSGYVTQDLLHAAGRQASKDLWFALLLILGMSLFASRMRPWRRPLLYLLAATLLSTALVGLLKRWTNVDCPWDLLRYGGNNAYYSLFMHRPSLLGHAKCFPAGHASAGYAWVALYFVWLETRPRWRWWGLGFALALGLIFGFAQQLRGAHFLSHDLWALMICWLVALSLHRWMLAGRCTSFSSQVVP